MSADRPSDHMSSLSFYFFANIQIFQAALSQTTPFLEALYRLAYFYAYGFLLRFLTA